MLEIWQLNTEKLIDNLGSWYYYTNVYYGLCDGSADALDLAHSILLAEQWLLLNRDGAAETIRVGVKRPGEPRDAIQDAGYILPGKRTDDGSPLLPAWVVALVTFVTAEGVYGRKWYRCGITETAWLNGPAAGPFAVGYQRYSRALVPLLPRLYLPGGQPLPPPPPHPTFALYGLRHGTLRRLRPVF